MVNGYQTCYLTNLICKNLCHLRYLRVFDSRRLIVALRKTKGETLLFYSIFDSTERRLLF